MIRYDNGDVKLLDLVAGKLRFETNVSNGVCGVEFDRNDIEMNKLVARAAHSLSSAVGERKQATCISFLGAARTLPSCPVAVNGVSSHLPL